MPSDPGQAMQNTAVQPVVGRLGLLDTALLEQAVVAVAKAERWPEPAMVELAPEPATELVAGQEQAAVVAVAVEALPTAAAGPEQVAAGPELPIAVVAGAAAEAVAVAVEVEPIAVASLRQAALEVEPVEP